MATDATKEIFLEALEHVSGERTGFIQRRCAGDAARARRVASLLEAHEGAGRFMSDPTTLGSGEVAGATLRPGETLGNYRIIRLLGEGGFGDVYLAEQMRPVVRPVAIKMLKLGMDTRELIGRFEAERQALALMEHPGIARVHDADATEKGRPYFVMEYVPGEAITDFCDKHRLNVRQRLEIFAQVCGAVQHAHQKGVIHRDIKPSNVLVGLIDGQPAPKVIDFGIAKAIGAAKLSDGAFTTGDRRVLGTPQYMAPEQASVSSASVDTRTDVYALGVLLYELLVGVSPFDPQRLRRASATDLERILREEEPPRPSVRYWKLGVQSEKIARQRGMDPVRLRRELRGDLDWIVMCALEKDPARRYPTAYALAQDVRRHLRFEPVDAGPPSGLYRAGKFWRRHRVGVMVAAALLLTAAAAVGVSAWFATETWRARREEGAARREAMAMRALADERAHLAALRTANEALRLNDPPTARRRLAEAPESQRDWAWRHLSGLLTREIGSVGPIAADKSEVLAVSPDGAMLATAWADETVRVHSADDMRELFAFEGVPPFVRSLAFGPASDRLYAADSDGRMWAWDLRSGRLLAEVRAHENVVPAMLATPGAVYTASWDGTVVERHPLTLRAARTWSTGGPPCANIWINAARDRLAVAAWDQQVYLFDLASGQRIATFRPHREQTPPEEPIRWAAGRVAAARFSPDGRFLVTGTADGRVALWSGRDGSHLRDLGLIDAIVREIDVSDDSRLAAVACRDAMVRVWDLEDPDAEGRLFEGHTLDVRDAEFAPDGRLLTCSWDGSVRIWDVASGRPLAIHRGHSELVFDAIWAAGGDRVVSRSEDGSVRLWPAGAAHYDVLAADEQPMTSVAILDADRFIASGGWRAARVCNIGSLEPGADLRARGRPVVVRADASGRLVAVASVDAPIGLWDAASGEPLAFMGDRGIRVTAMAFSPDGRTLAAVTAHDRVESWDTQSGLRRFGVQLVPAGLNSLCFTADGRSLVVSSWEGPVHVLDASSGELLRTLERPGRGQTYALAPHPYENVVAVGGEDRVIRLVNVRTGAVQQELRGHGDAVETIAFFPGAEMLVSGSRSGLLRLWDLRRGDEIIPLHGHRWRIHDLAVSPDGSAILSAGADGTVRIWRAGR